VAGRLNYLGRYVTGHLGQLSLLSLRDNDGVHAAFIVVVVLVLTTECPYCQTKAYFEYQGGLDVVGK